MHLHHVAEREDLRVAGQREIRADRDSPGAVELGSRFRGERPGQLGGDDAGGPDDRPRRNPFALALAGRNRHRRLVDVDDGPPEERRHAQQLERVLRPLRKPRRELRQDAIRRLDEEDPRRARLERAEVAAQRVAGDLGDLPGELDARRPCADDDEREPGGTPLGILLDLGGFERREDPAAHFERALEQLHVGRERAPVVVPEVRIARAAGDDQAVVRDRVLGIAVRKRADEHAALAQVEAGDFAEQDADVLVALEDAAKRRGDLAGRERAGRNLVHERLEEMEVAPVDQRDLDRLVTQASYGLQAAEPAADDDDTMAPAVRGHVAAEEVASTARAPAARTAAESVAMS